MIAIHEGDDKTDRNNIDIIVEKKNVNNDDRNENENDNLSKKDHELTDIAKILLEQKNQARVEHQPPSVDAAVEAMGAMSLKKIAEQFLASSEFHAADLWVQKSEHDSEQIFSLINHHTIQAWDLLNETFVGRKSSTNNAKFLGPIIPKVLSQNTPVMEFFPSQDNSNTARMKFHTFMGVPIVSPSKGVLCFYSLGRPQGDPLQQLSYIQQREKNLNRELKRKQSSDQYHESGYHHGQTEDHFHQSQYSGYWPGHEDRYHQPSPYFGYRSTGGFIYPPNGQDQGQDYYDHLYSDFGAGGYGTLSHRAQESYLGPSSPKRRHQLRTQLPVSSDDTLSTASSAVNGSRTFSSDSSTADNEDGCYVPPHLKWTNPHLHDRHHQQQYVEDIHQRLLRHQQPQMSQQRMGPSIDSDSSLWGQSMQQLTGSFPRHLASPFAFPPLSSSGSLSPPPPRPPPPPMSNVSLYTSTPASKSDYQSQPPIRSSTGEMLMTPTSEQKGRGGGGASNLVLKIVSQTVKRRNGAILHLCRVEGCEKLAQGSTNFCISHGGGNRCVYPGCKHGARDKFLCATHGGGKRCAHENCTKAAVGKYSFCTSHGGGRRCEEPGCTKAAQSNTKNCVRHGGGKRCSVEGCKKVARGKTHFCTHHYTEEQNKLNLNSDGTVRNIHIQPNHNPRAFFDQSSSSTTKHILPSPSSKQVKQPILPSSSSSSSSSTTTTTSSSSNNPNLSGALKFQNYQFSKN